MSRSSAETRMEWAPLDGNSGHIWHARRSSAETRKEWALDRHELARRQTAQAAAALKPAWNGHASATSQSPRVTVPPQQR